MHAANQDNSPPAFKRRAWTTSEVRLLRQAFPNLPNRQVAEQFQRSVSSITSKANELGLRKSEAFFCSPQACRFTKESHQAARLAQQLITLTMQEARHV